LRNGYRALKRVNLGWHVWQAIEKRQYDTTRGTRVVAVSQMVRGHLQRYHGLDPRRVCVIPNAIDAGRLRLDDALTVRAALRRRLGLAETDVLALFLAHNFRLKGLAPLLRALKRRRERDPRGQPLHLAVCGGGDPAPFRRLADRLDIGSHVHFLGFQPDVRPIVRAADYFVLPTYFDPCSLVVFEALACGLPVITTRLNGAGELITPGREGFVVETPDSIAELAEALASLTDPEIRLSMAEHARRLGAEQTFEKHLHSLVALFGEVAADRAGAALNRPHALPRHARGPCVSEMAASTPSHGPGSSEPRP
jgi:UDP-glucose:(heptosyl)LPS alpha-1,3-glucosyltransferase